MNGISHFPPFFHATEGMFGSSMNESEGFLRDPCLGTKKMQRGNSPQALGNPSKDGKAVCYGFLAGWWRRIHLSVEKEKNAPERKIKSESRLAHQFLSSAHSARETRFDEVVDFLNYGC